MTEGKTARERLIDLFDEYGREEYIRGKLDGIKQATDAIRRLTESESAGNDAEGQNQPNVANAQVRRRIRIIRRQPSNEPPFPFEEEEEREFDRLRPDSDMATVLELIRQEPGLAGFEIVNKLDGRVHERTVRTALHRLRHDKKLIEIQEGKWFPIKE